MIQLACCHKILADAHKKERKSTKLRMTQKSTYRETSKMTLESSRQEILEISNGSCHQQWQLSLIRNDYIFRARSNQQSTRHERNHNPPKPTLVLFTVAEKDSIGARNTSERTGVILLGRIVALTNVPRSQSPRSVTERSYGCSRSHPDFQAIQARDARKSHKLWLLFSYCGQGESMVNFGRPLGEEPGSKKPRFNHRFTQGILIRALEKELTAKAR